MATYTPNYNLEKPDSSDPFGDFRQSYNSNMDIIDQNLGGGGGGDSVSWTQIQNTGTKIAEIDINGTTTDVYAPNGSGDISALLQGMAVGRYTFDSNVVDDRDYYLEDENGNLIVARQTILFERE